MHHFWAHNGPFTRNNFFLENIINIIFIYLLVPFIVQNLGPKWPIWSNESFFRKSVNNRCSFHSWLSTCPKSKSDIDLLMIYWQLKNNEILGILGYNLRTRFFLTRFYQIFRRMLMNDKNFCFTQLPDKTNDIVFLRSPKTLFWTGFDHFWSFLPNGEFSKRYDSVTDNYIRTLTPC